MEWIKAILDKHSDENGVVNLDEAMKEINQEFPKKAVPKEQYNNVSQQLKDANNTLGELKEQTKDNPSLQKKLEESELARTKAENDLIQLQIRTQASDKLRDGNVKDVDYALYKIGVLELDDKGEIKDFETKFNTFKEAFPSHIGSTEAPAPKVVGANPALATNTEIAATNAVAQKALDLNKNEGTNTVNVWS